MTAPAIPGYRLGDPTLPRAPYTMEDLEQLKRALLVSDDDVAALRRAGEILGPRVEELLDVWYNFVGSTDSLVHDFRTLRGRTGSTWRGYVLTSVSGSVTPVGPGSTKRGLTTLTRLGGATLTGRTRLVTLSGRHPSSTSAPRSPWSIRSTPRFAPSSSRGRATRRWWSGCIKPGSRRCSCKPFSGPIRGEGTW